MMGFFMFVIVAVLGLLALVGGLQWLEFHHHRRRRSVNAPGDAPSRLDRMESALGALESRLDELQDQQRFLERLLAERPKRQSLPRPDEEAEGQAGSGSILFDTEPSEGDR